MSDALVEVRVDRPQYRHDGEQYERDDTLEVPKRVLNRHPNSLERIEEATAAEPGDDAGDADAEIELTDEDGGTIPFNPTNFSVDEVEDRIADIEDADTIRSLRTLEQTEDGDPRTTAIEAFDARIDELEG